MKKKKEGSTHPDIVTITPPTTTTHQGKVTLQVLAELRKLIKKRYARYLMCQSRVERLKREVCLVCVCVYMCVKFKRLCGMRAYHINPYTPI